MPTFLRKDQSQSQNLNVLIKSNVFDTMPKVKTMQRPGNPNPALKTKTGNKLKLQIVKKLRQHMVNQVSRWPLSYINITNIYMNTRRVKRNRNSDIKNRQQRTTTEVPPWNGQ